MSESRYFAYERAASFPSPFLSLFFSLLGHYVDSLELSIEQISKFNLRAIEAKQQRQ